MATYPANTDSMGTKTGLRTLMLIPLAPLVLIAIGYLLSKVDWQSVSKVWAGVVSLAPQIGVIIVLLVLTAVAVHASRELAYKKGYKGISLRVHMWVATGRSVLFSLLVGVLTFLFIFPLNTQYAQDGPYTGYVRTSAAQPVKRLFELPNGAQRFGYASAASSGLSSYPLDKTYAESYKDLGAVYATQELLSNEGVGQDGSPYPRLAKKVPVTVNGQKTWALLDSYGEYGKVFADGSGFIYLPGTQPVGWEVNDNETDRQAEQAALDKLITTRSNWDIRIQKTLASSSNPFIAFWGRITTQ